MAVVAVGTTALLDDVLTLVDPEAVPLRVVVPWYVYAYGLLGAFGYVFTTLIREFDRSAMKVLQANLRVPAAIPLAAGVYVLATQFLGGVPPQRLMAGLAFVAGLYVNLTYERIGRLADRLLATDDSDEGEAKQSEGSGPPIRESGVNGESRDDAGGTGEDGLGEAVEDTPGDAAGDGHGDAVEDGRGDGEKPRPDGSRADDAPAS
ncbi:hypothetical protein BRD00_12505 [Halobacteriales archaeon QS_8_69_26]|nr:MAG: hypothetical protein BRD00_12505 [Halobacteriales archaeon QS_8_69_26]